jgi:hypothetical protein
MDDAELEQVAQFCGFYRESITDVLRSYEKLVWSN